MDYIEDLATIVSVLPKDCSVLAKQLDITVLDRKLFLPKKL